MDRILSAILVAVIAAIGICSLSDPSSGEGADIESDGIAYTLDDDGTATVSGYTGAGGIVVIPQSVTHDGKEYAVRSIGDSAFKEAAGLTGIVIPDAVAEMGHEAFSKCENLEYAYIGSGIETISGHAFYGCGSLTEVAGMKNLRAIGDWAFVSTGLKTFHIPDTVTSIGDHVFPTLDTVTIGSGVSKIGEDPFGSFHPYFHVSEGNATFASLDGALYSKDMRVLAMYPYDSGPSNVVVPETVEHIADRAFEFSHIISIDLGNVTSIGNESFRQSSLRSLDVPGTDIFVGNHAFEECRDLETVTFGTGTVGIGSEAFIECPNLLSISFSGPVVELGEYAIMDCESLQSVNFGNSLTKVPRGTCVNCPSLETITGLEGVEVIGDFAFRDARLESFTVPESVTHIGKHVLSGELKTVTLGSKVVSIGVRTFDGRDLESIHVAEDNPAFTSIDGVLYDKSVSTLLICPGSFSHLTVPEGVRTIDESACNRNDRLVSVDLPDSLERIEDCAFLWCSNITEVTLPESLTHIGVESFGSCERLYSISIPESVTCIDTYAFNLSGLKRVQYNCTDATVGESAFQVYREITFYTDGIELSPDAVGKAVAEYRPIDEYSEWTEDDDGADTWILAAIAGIVFVTIAAVWMFRRTKE